MNSLLIALSFITYSASAQSEFDKKLKSLYKNTVETIRPVEVEKLMKDKNIVLLDTRTIEEFNVSHLKGAQLLDYDSYSTDDLKRIAKNATIIVYCSVGVRSELVGEKFIELGYNNVLNIYGGIFEWKNKGYNVVNKSNQPTDSVHTYNKSWSKWLEHGVKIY
ncbi:MAG: rhodanese-like domain-containing protein [Bacteroidia bacterium]|nr:rhodanese-like domain-containing protein [Bacteroidia bacterium]